MIVLDTTILIYTTGVEHPLRLPCQRLVDAIAEGRIQATTTPEVIQEFAHVRARRLARSEAVRTARAFANLLAPLLLVDEAMLTLGLRIYEETAGIGSFDSVLAATAITASADALVSADRGFAAVRGLTHLDPAAPDFLEQLGSG
jgi:predicted nucleic acid-binding protein